MRRTHATACAGHVLRVSALLELLLASSPPPPPSSPPHLPLFILLPKSCASEASFYAFDACAASHVIILGIRMINWSQLCAAQVNRPLWQLQQADYGCCLFAVTALPLHRVATCARSVRCPLLVSNTLPQVVSFACAAVYSGLWCWRWATDGVKNRLWPQLGVFSGLVCLGSVAGAVAWGARMQSFVYYYDISAPGATRQQYLPHPCNISLAYQPTPPQVLLLRCLLCPMVCNLPCALRP